MSFAYDSHLAQVYGRFDVPRTLRIVDRNATDVQVKTWEEANGFSGEFAAFVACIQGRATPRATGIDGKRALQLGLAIKESGQSGRSVTINL